MPKKISEHTATTLADSGDWGAVYREAAATSDLRVQFGRLARVTPGGTPDGGTTFLRGNVDGSADWVVPGVAAGVPDPTVIEVSTASHLLTAAQREHLNVRLDVLVGTRLNVPRNAGRNWSWAVHVATAAQVDVGIQDNVGSVNGKAAGEVVRAAFTAATLLVVVIANAAGDAPVVHVLGDITDDVVWGAAVDGNSKILRNVLLHEILVDANRQLARSDAFRRLVCRQPVTLSLPAVGTLGSGWEAEVFNHSTGVCTVAGAARSVLFNPGDTGTISEANGRQEIVRAASQRLDV
jgi:hypothetical protein